MHQLIDECCEEVPERQKQNMENRMFDLVKICHHKQFLCIHDEVDDLIESAFDSKLLSINSINSQRLDKKEQEVKIVEEQPAERRNRAEKSLQNFRVIHKSFISLNTSKISSIHAVAPILLTREPKNSLSMRYEHLSITPETEFDEVTECNAENLLPIPSECESDNSLLDNFSPEFEIFCDHSEKTRSGNTTHANYSLHEYDSFCFEIKPDQERLINLMENNNSDDSSNDPLLEEVDLFLSYNLIPPEVPEQQKQNMEKTMLDLVKICHHKQFLCIHDDVDNLIESVLDSKLLSINSINSQRLDKKEQEVKIIEEQPAERSNHAEKSLQNFRVIYKSSISLKDTSQISLVHAVAPILSTKEPENELSMGYEHLSITPETEITESNAKNLLPIPSECEVTLEDKRECDELICENSSTINVCDNHSEILFDSNNDDLSSDDESFEDIEYVDASVSDPAIVSVEEENVVQQEEEESDNSLLDNFSLECETFCDHSEETRSGNTIHANYSLPEYDLFCFKIEPDQEKLINLMENNISDSSNDPLLEEVDLFLSDNSIPPGIENVADDPEGDVRFLKELLIDDSILSHELSDDNFEDNPSISRPPPEPPDVESFFDLKLDMIAEEISDKLNEDKCFDPGREINVSTKIEDDDHFSFMIVIRFFLPYFIFPELLSINSQRLDKKEQKVKNVVEQPAERGNRIEKSLQNFRVIHKSFISLKNTSQISPVHAIAPILSTKEPEYSPSMRYEHPNTTPETKSDEIIKSGVEEFIPILSENEVTSEDKRKCNVPVYENSPICDNHSEIFSDSNNDDDISSDDDDFEDIEYVEASLSDPEILLSLTRLIANIESLNDNPTPDCVLNSFVSFPISEFETFCDHTEETRSGSTTTHADDSLTEYDSFCFKIEPDQERLINVMKNDISHDSSNDPLLEEADLFLAFDNSIPPGIENFVDDSKGDVRFLKELLIDDSIPFPVNESPEYDFDNPSFPRPPPKPPHFENDA
nr:hypothetical protein [Tanacetum cinerariifolium]